MGRVYRKEFEDRIEYYNSPRMNQLHRDFDRPAVEHINGDKEWWINGERHRLNGPAIERVDGYKDWWVYGLRHRVDGPAIEWVNGIEIWYLEGYNYSEEKYRQAVIEYRNKNKLKEEITILENINGLEWRNYMGELHREDGPAVDRVDGAKGAKGWFINGKLHRLDGPAVEYANGGKLWYQNGLRHREGGPAIDRADGSKFWWIDGKTYTEEEFNKYIKDNGKCL